MASSFSISVDLSQLLGAGPLARTQIFGNLSLAVKTVIETGEERWREAVQAAPGLRQGEKDAYAASISSRMINPYQGEIVSDYRYVEDIESGRPPYDLKQMLNTSMKVRVSKAGKRYLVIPFRHNTPGAIGGMPSAVYSQARKLKASSILGTGSRASGTGAYDPTTRAPFRVAKHKYVWGGRLGRAAGPRLPGHHKSERHDGMVRMKTSTGGSQFLTFRVMVEGSSGWVIPARPGLWIARAVSDSLQRSADQMFPEAVAADIAA